MMDAEERAALRALAETATPGPWTAEYERTMRGVVNMYWIHETASLGVQHDSDARYIGAANPAALLALLDALDTAEATIDRQMKTSRIDTVQIGRLLAERDAAIARAGKAEADARRYCLLRRGQTWSVVDGIGDTLRGDLLDAAIDAALAAKEKSNG